jgi:hypothetical protein
VDTGATYAGSEISVDISTPSYTIESTDVSSFGGGVTSYTKTLIMTISKRVDTSGTDNLYASTLEISFVFN